MKEQVKMPLSDFIRLNENELHGWIYIQPDSVSGLVNADSICVVVDFNDLSRNDLDCYDAKMKQKGFIVSLMEPWEFFGYIEFLKKRSTFELQKMVDGLNYFIANDTWP